jgi:hypothetical protein
METGTVKLLPFINELNNTFQMESAANNKPSFLKRQMNKLNNSTHEFMLEICIIATILFCLNFWTNLPDLGIDPVWGRAVAAIGMLILFCMIAFRFKWPILVGLAALVVYLGISYIKSPENTVVKTETEVNSNPQQGPLYNVSTHYMGKDSVK